MSKSYKKQNKEGGSGVYIVDKSIIRGGPTSGSVHSVNIKAVVPRPKEQRAA
ncbi:hypothetical protein H6784_05055 [Candidatus Nomurabacteria bacterium]|nr:hypothetical protein [Candidatus Kaiserbacteria bacterium]MCB9814754.1 hypothetical protein [Candidatus Nomurabacteria bacterium]